MYVFDTSPFSALFKSFYRRRFPSLWAQFDELIDNRAIISTREVRRELELYGNEECEAWLRDHRNVFTIPTAVEALFITDIYRVHHFQQKYRDEEDSKRRAECRSFRHCKGCN